MVLEVIEKFVSQRKIVSEFSIKHMLLDAEDRAGYLWACQVNTKKDDFADKSLDASISSKW